jgi:hypothetical protein
VVLGAVAVVQLARFRRSNGVRVAGLTGRVVLGTSTAASLSYAAGLAAGVWSALQGVVWLVLVSSLAGGAAYARSGRRWWLGYRRDPAADSRGESGIYLVCLSVLALAGAVVLLTAG